MKRWQKRLCYTPLTIILLLGLLGVHVMVVGWFHDDLTDEQQVLRGLQRTVITLVVFGAFWLASWAHDK
jgi:hypothetical protein